MRKILLVLVLFFSASVLNAGQVKMMYRGTGGGGACADDCSGNKGDTYTDGSESLVSTEYYMSVNKIDLGACDGSNGTLNLYLKDTNLGSTATVKFIVYDDDGTGGEPGTKLYESSSGTVLDDTAYKYYSESIASAGCLTGVVWAGYICTLGGGGLHDQYKSTGNGGARMVVNANFSAPASWDEDGDTHSGNNRPFYISFP